MRRVSFFLSILTVLLAAIVAVANRQTVTFSLDPTSTAHPALVIDLPLYLVVFFAFFFGVVFGIVSMLKRRGEAKPQKPRSAPTQPEVLAISREAGPKSE